MKEKEEKERRLIELIDDRIEKGPEEATDCKFCYNVSVNGEKGLDILLTNISHT